MNRPPRTVLALGAGTTAVLAVGVTIGIASLGSHGSTAEAQQGHQSGSQVAAVTHHHPQASARSVTQPVVQPVSVPALRHLTPPDAVVSLRHAATATQLHRLRAMTGVRQVAALDRGHVTLRTHGHRATLSVAGLPLQTIRGFTPQVTAASDALWRSVAAGELTVTFTSERSLGHESLGKTLPISGASQAADGIRVGAFATLGLPGVEAAVSHATAQHLGLAPARDVLVSAPKISLDALKADLHRALDGIGAIRITRPAPVDQSEASPYALQMIPASYLDLYRRAAPTCPGLPWTVLAGIGTVETGNGANIARSVAGAEGPMQFMPATWKTYGVDADGDGKADINDPVDAVFSAAKYLCAAGASQGGRALNNAIFAYNHAWWYVRMVVDLANKYA